MLDGLTFKREGNFEAKGKQDLPYVQWYGLEDEEDWTAGAGTPVKSERKLLLEICAFRAYGMFRRDPTAALADSDTMGGGKGVLEWVELVRDAIETKTTGETDPLLDGTQSRPILTAIREQTPSDLGWSFLLEVTVTIDSMCRGMRSL